MKYNLLIGIFIFLLSCEEPPKKESDFFDNIENNQESYKSIDEKIIRHIESNLSIPRTEKYSFKIFKERLNDDDSLDYVIVVNRLQKALDEAIESNNIAKRAEMGYMGNFNYFFYMDGLTKEITPAVAVPSSPYAELEVTFENIKTEAYFDFMVDFRIRNSKFRRFYTVIDDTPRQTFEAKIFDRLGETNPEAYIVKFVTGSFSFAKDIWIYKGILENVKVNSPNDVYTINPNITPTEELERKWFFSDTQNKYFTEK